MPEQSIEAKRIIGYVPESASLYESLTAQEYLELIGRLREIEEKALKQKIVTLLETFDIAKQRFSRLATFSKGMRQKVLIAAALLHNPPVLLLDEPLTGLDVSSSLVMKDLLSALSREGKTVLYSSHVLDVVERVCNRVLIIHEGNLIADGTLDSLKDQTKGSTLEEVFRQLTHSDKYRTDDFARAGSDEAMMELRSSAEEIVKSKSLGKLCGILGINIRQYRLLLGLFSTLSDRLEFMGLTAGLNKALGFYLVGSLLLSLVVLAKPTLPGYLLFMIGFSMFILLWILLMDAANSIMNPDEASVLAHQPISGATYVAAKLTHVLVIVGAIIPALNLIPAIAGLSLRDSRWFYPLTHLLAAYLAGLFIAFLVCGIYGWLFRFISPANLKNASLWLQLLAFMVMPIFQQVAIHRPALEGFESSAQCSGRHGCHGAGLWRSV